MSNKKQKSVFSNRSFALLFWGKLMSQLGDSIFTFALIWYLLSITGKAVQSGIVMALSIIPSIILGPIGGVVADRFNRVKIIVVTDMIRGVIMVILFVMAQNGNLSLLSIYIAIVLLSIFGSLFTPASTSIIPSIVGNENLMQANSLDSVVVNMSQIIGAFIGAILYQAVGINGVLLINAVSFLGSGSFEIFIKVQNQKVVEKTKATVKSGFDDMKEGFRYLRSNKPLYILFLFLIFWNFCIFPIMQVYLPFVFNNILHASALQLSLVQVAFGVGVIIASTTTFGEKTTSFSKQITVSYLMVSIVLFLDTIPLSPLMKNAHTSVIVAFFLVVSVLCGVFIGRGYIPVGVVYQKDVPDELRGRVNGFLLTFEKVAAPIGYVVAGFLTQKIEMYKLNAISTAVLIIVCLLLMSSKEVKKL